MQMHKQVNAKLPSPQQKIVGRGGVEAGGGGGGGGGGGPMSMSFSSSCLRVLDVISYGAAWWYIVIRSHYWPKKPGIPLSCDLCLHTLLRPDLSVPLLK